MLNPLQPPSSLPLSHWPPHVNLSIHRKTDRRWFINFTAVVSQSCDFPPQPERNRDNRIAVSYNYYDNSIHPPHPSTTLRHAHIDWSLAVILHSASPPTVSLSLHNRNKQLLHSNNNYYCLLADQVLYINLSTGRWLVPDRPVCDSTTIQFNRERAGASTTTKRLILSIHHPPITTQPTNHQVISLSVCCWGCSGATTIKAPSVPQTKNWFSDFRSPVGSAAIYPTNHSTFTSSRSL